MSINTISVVMIAKNAEETIEECLDALVRFSEVVLYLNHSTDQTEEKAKKFPNVKIVSGAFLGFGETKNAAATFAKNNWILSLDTDEILNNTLIDEISNIDILETKRVYWLKRENYFLGHATQSKDTIVRIYNRTITQFNANKVHEKIVVPFQVESLTLQTPFKHLNITNINQTLTKIIHYTDLGAKEKKTCFFGTVIAKSLFAFFKTYILQGNILKGWVGYVLAVNSANKRHYKYVKQYIHCQEEKKK